MMKNEKKSMYVCMWGRDNKINGQSLLKAVTKLKRAIKC
jgi:hypothetical protein